MTPPKSTGNVPAHSFDRIEKLSPGGVVNVEVGLLPVGLSRHPDEQASYLQLPLRTLT